MAGKTLKRIVLGAALALAAAGTAIGIRGILPEDGKTSAKSVEYHPKIENWSVIEEGGVHYFNIRGHKYSRYVIISNKVSDKIIDQEYKRSIENPNYHSPYAIHDHLEFAGKAREQGK
jgi:hypothetical protein